MTNEQIANALRTSPRFQDVRTSEEARDEVLADAVADLIFEVDFDSPAPAAYGSAQGYLYGRVSEVLSEISA